jgi:hypothetical protein
MLNRQTYALCHIWKPREVSSAVCDDVICMWLTLGAQAAAARPTTRCASMCVKLHRFFYWLLYAPHNCLCCTRTHQTGAAIKVISIWSLWVRMSLPCALHEHAHVQCLQALAMLCNSQQQLAPWRLHHRGCCWGDAAGCLFVIVLDQLCLGVSAGAQSAVQSRGTVCDDLHQLCITRCFVTSSVVMYLSE